MSRHVFILLITCLNYIVCNAQIYPFVHYTRREGLVNNRVKCIYQDSRGKIYFATYGGLSVYDGCRFSNYTTNDGLITSLVNSIMEIGPDSILVIPNGSALHLLTRGKIENIPLEANRPCVNEMIRCKKNSYYYAMADEGLFRFSTTKYAKIFLHGLPVSDPKNLVHASECDGYLFINSDVKSPVYGQQNIFFAYEIATGKTICADHLPVVTFSVCTPDNNILVATDKGIYQISKAALSAGKIEFQSLCGPYAVLSRVNTDYMYFDHQQNLWLTTLQGIVKLSTQGQLQLISSSNGLPGNFFSYLFQDSENDIWLASEQTGVTKFSRQDAIFYPTLNNHGNINLIACGPSTDTIWCYNAVEKNIYLIHKENIQCFSGPGGNIFSCIASNGTVTYASTGNKLYSLTLKSKNYFSASELYSESSSVNMRSYGYNCILDKEGNLIAVGGNVIAVLKNNKIFKYPLSYYSGVGVLTKNDLLWIVTRSNKLYCFKISPSNPQHYFQLLRVYDKELPVMDPRSITADKHGNVWIGTRNRGIFCLQFKNDKLTGARKIGIEDGLTDNFIQTLYCDANENVWAGSPQGVDKLTSLNNQLIINNYPGGSNLFLNIISIIGDSQHNIWALASTGGVLKIIAEKDPPSVSVPKMMFTKIQAGNTELQPDGNKVSLPYKMIDFTFQVAEPSFLNEHDIRFRFKLNGTKESGWSAYSSIGEINYVRLPSGEYSLIAEAFFINSRYPAQRIIFHFIIGTPWWQTWWFITFEAIATLSFIFLVLRVYYRNKMQKQLLILEKQQAIEKERTRIATDMHDDLGEGLTRIKFLSESLKLKNNEGRLSFKDLDKITLYSEDMINKMGEIVWALNERNDSLSDLVGFTRAYAAEYLSDNKLRSEIHAGDSFPEMFLSGEVRRNIFLSVKEILHNIVKHACANHVFISIVYKKGLHIIIKDNGIGIDFAVVRKYSNGLNNIQKRMADIGGSLRIYKDCGTTVELNIP